MAVDGEYGPETVKAVKRYQKLNSLEEDGNWGPQTRAKAAQTGFVFEPVAEKFKGGKSTLIQPDGERLIF